MWDDVNLLARIVEHTPVSIVVTQLEGKILYVNDCAAKVLRVERPALLGAAVDTFVTHLDSGKSWHSVMAQILAGQSCELYAAITGSDSEEHICKLKAFPIETSGTPVALAFIFIDETEELHKAEQIEKKNLEMARMNTELIRSNAELKKLSELKSSFLSIASHELKTPLTSIKGYSDIIIDGMRDKLDPDIYRMVENINRAADRLHKVVNNILDVTRMEQKRLRLQPEYVKLGSIVRECIEELSTMTTNRKIAFISDIAESLPDFYGDKIRMHQVFTNILSNAVKFSPDESTVDIRIFLEEDSRFHIIVKDKGIGIDKTDQKRIFDPFYEVGNANRHSTSSTRFMGRGTGLGLSIVKGVIECHGGRVWVLSEGSEKDIYKGSEFHILLPMRIKTAVEEDETEPIAVDRIGAPEAGPVSIDQKPEILFIDSDRESVEIARMVLDTAFEMIVLENGEQGLQIAFRKQPSIILLSTAQPGIDGYRICKILKSQEDTREIPVVFISSDCDGAEIQKCFACGADDFVVKPFNGKELFNKIWRVLMKKKEDATFK
jgi:PAS domain S-box-containing protein